MPAFKWCGHTYLISADDFVFIFPWLIPLHLLWATLNSSRFIDEAMTLIDCRFRFRMYDAVMCLATVPLDILISILSARGPVLKPRKCERALGCLLLVRLLICVPMMLNFALVARKAIIYIVANHNDNVKIISKGWGPQLQDKWDVYLVMALLTARLLFYLSLLSMLILLLVPKKVRKGVFSKGIRTFLFLLGCQDNMINGLMGIIMNDLGGHTTLEEVAPSDWMFGLFLVAYRQGQGFLNNDPDAPWVPLDEEGDKIRTRPERRGSRRLPKGLKRASDLRGVNREVTPFDPLSPEDHGVMDELARMMPYASGIYGQQFMLGFIMDSVQPGTHLPSLCRALRSCFAMCPCRQSHACDSSWDFLRRLGCCISCYLCCEPAGKTEADSSWAFHEDALLRAVETSARRRKAEEPELVFATWKNLGIASAPPIGVLVDHERREIIVTVRGTADMTSALADVGGTPLFFDPFGWAKEGDRRRHPFSNTDLFAHGSMLLCAEDAYHRLKSKRILEDLLFDERRCPGYGVVCVGHSLGAAVGCLLALILKQTLPKEVNVRYVGFEPPGGTLCERLSRETQRLGWFAVACSHDWVPRIGVRNLQKLKVKALLELHTCDRSKLQLTLLMTAGFVRTQYLLCCFRRPLAALLQWMGGGALPDSSSEPARSLQMNDQEEGKESADAEPGKPLLVSQETFSEELTFPELWPPGDIVYCRPLESSWKCVHLVEKDTEWTAMWADPQDLDELMLTTRAIDLHVPWVYEDAVGNVVSAFEEEADASTKASAAREAAKEQRLQGAGPLNRSRRPGFQLRDPPPPGEVPEQSSRVGV